MDVPILRIQLLDHRLRVALVTRGEDHNLELLTQLSQSLTSKWSHVNPSLTRNNLIQPTTSHPATAASAYVNRLSAREFYLHNDIGSNSHVLVTVNQRLIQVEDYRLLI